MGSTCTCTCTCIHFRVQFTCTCTVQFLEEIQIFTKAKFLSFQVQFVVLFRVTEISITCTHVHVM